MNAPAVRDHQSPLEAALVDVHAALTELLAAADAQYEAVVERDRRRLEDVTRQQERLASRLERAERKRQEILAERTLEVALVAEAAHVASLAQTIGSAVRELQARHARTATLIQKSIEVNGQTIQFLERLVGAATPVYGSRGTQASRQSVLVDSRA